MSQVEHTLVRTFNFSEISQDINMGFNICPGNDARAAKKRKADELLKQISPIAEKDNFMRLLVYRKLGLTDDFEELNNNNTRENIINLLKMFYQYRSFLTSDQQLDINGIRNGQVSLVDDPTVFDKLMEIVEDVQMQRQKSLFEVVDNDMPITLTENQMKDHFLNTLYSSNGIHCQTGGGETVFSSEHANSDD